MPPAVTGSELILSLGGKTVRTSQGEIRACDMDDGRKRPLPKGMKVYTSSHASLDV